MSYLESLDPILRIFHSQAAWICCTSTSSCWTFVVSPCRSQGWTNRYRLGQIENGGQETNCTMWKQWQILENSRFQHLLKKIICNGWAFRKCPLWGPRRASRIHCAPCHHASRALKDCGKGSRRRCNLCYAMQAVSHVTTVTAKVFLKTKDKNMVGRCR